jgi:cytochrome c biogenesis factor
MSWNRRQNRGLIVSLVTLFAAVFVGATAAPASAGEDYNNVEVNITGGKAHALAACVNYAKLKAKKGEAAQSNACKNFAKATGGDVNLKNVDITILQAGSGSGTVKNNAEVNISGGDATAVAACVNYLQGTADSDQKNKCKNTADAKGGDVTLKNVTITIIQG